MSDSRTTALVMRIKPKDKALLVKMAKTEHRSQTNMLEQLIREGAEWRKVKVRKSGESWR